MSNSQSLDALVRVALNNQWSGKPTMKHDPAPRVGRPRARMWNGERFVSPSHGWMNVEWSYQDVFDAITVDGLPVTAQVKGGDTGKGHRSADDVIATSLMLIDIDNKTTDGSRKLTVEEGYRTIGEIVCEDFYNKYGSGFYASPTHTIAHHKVRLLFRLEAALTDGSEINTLYKALIDICDADQSCKDPCRFFNGCVTHLKEIRENVLPEKIVKALVDEYKGPAIKHVARPEFDNIQRDQVLKLTREMFDTVPDVNGYKQWITVAMAMKDAGYTVDDFVAATAGGLSRPKTVDDCHTAWDGLRRTGGAVVTIATLFRMLNANGFKVKSPKPKLPPRPTMTVEEAVQINNRIKDLEKQLNEIKE
jgi:hypothetical protein